MPHEAYGKLYNGLSLADFVLQTSLAGELLLRSMPRGRRLLTGAAALFVATGMTLLSTVLLPARSPVPADRATIFTGLLFVTLFGVAVVHRSRGWMRSVVMGLAAVGLSGALAECGKSVAAFHRNGHAYVAWSYGNASVYLTVLACWIFASSRRGREAGHARKATIRFVRGSI